MSKINILDSSVYNLISAGEVVENPSSVVKELVENSIDSGANEINIFIEDGGIKSISVSDNGSGIEKNELKKTVLPHATSKIYASKDLLTIGTLGFRGEALASIASVSEFIIKSKFIESDTAFLFKTTAGKDENIESTNLAQGTSVTVNNLFFNTPVRYKFLKSTKTETSEITTLIKNFIFSNPEISFKYYIDSKLVLKSNGNGLMDAVYSVFDINVAQSLIPINYKSGKYILTGFLAKPATDAIINNRNKQIFIINGRLVNNSVLSAVVQNAYGDYLMKRSFPIFILDLIMPFDLVDVNVHPNKKEVRFADSRVINGVFYNAVKEALNKNYADAQENLKNNLFASNINAYNNSDIKKEFYNDNSVIKYATEVASNKSENITPQNSVENSEYKWDTDTASKQYDYAKSDNKYKDWDKNTLNDNVENKILEPSYDGEYVFSDINTNTDLFIKPEKVEVTEKINYRIVGQIFDTYILLESGDNFILVDQHATHERIIFDKLIKESDVGVDMQQLLFPYSVPIDTKESEELEKQLININKLGFQMEIKSNKLTLNAIPYMLAKLDISDFLNDVKNEIKEINKISSFPLVRSKLASMACKKAIKGGDKLNKEQLDYVVDYFFNNNNIALQCPHGRPTVTIFTKNEIEKMFRRIV